MLHAVTARDDNDQLVLLYRSVARSKNVGWTHMVSTECEPITWSGSAGSRAETLVRWSGGEAPEAGKPFSFWMPNGSSKFASFSVF